MSDLFIKPPVPTTSLKISPVLLTARSFGGNNLSLLHGGLENFGDLTCLIWHSKIDRGVNWS
jgi:hypothetical protein